MLIVEQEAHNLPPFGVQYVARDNPCGVALELLLYGDTGNPTPNPNPNPTRTPNPTPNPTPTPNPKPNPTSTGAQACTPPSHAASCARAPGSSCRCSPISPHISPTSPLYLAYISPISP